MLSPRLAPFRGSARGSVRGRRVLTPTEGGASTKNRVARQQTPRVF